MSGLVNRLAKVTKVIGRGLLRGTTPVFAFEEMRKTTKNSLRIAGVSVKNSN
jgi:hypothetical protein